MIDSKKTYLHYLEEDRKALGIKKAAHFSFLNPYEIETDIYKFQKTLRKCEYLYNLDNGSVVWKIKKHFAALKFKKLSIKLGFTIPPNCFGPGLRIMHRGTIVVNGQCKIGANCTINIDVNIGTNAGYIDKVPILGKNIYIGPGAKLFGDIVIADGCAIGANCVVNKSFLVPSSILVGVPATCKGTLNRELRVY
jgi:serine O-acetyltransferase